MGAHHHAAGAVELRRVGEDFIDGGVKPRRLQDPVDEQGVGVGDDDAVHGAFILQNERQQVRHAVSERDALHHAADVVGADALVSCEERRTKVRKTQSAGQTAPPALTDVLHHPAHVLQPQTPPVGTFNRGRKTSARKTSEKKEDAMKPNVSSGL